MTLNHLSINKFIEIIEKYTDYPEIISKKCFESTLINSNILFFMNNLEEIDKTITNIEPLMRFYIYDLIFNENLYNKFIKLCMDYHEKEVFEDLLVGFVKCETYKYMLIEKSDISNEFMEDFIEIKRNIYEAINYIYVSIKKGDYKWLKTNQIIMFLEMEIKINE